MFSSGCPSACGAKIVSFSAAGWKVYVDGERQKLYNANGQYMAVYLTSGTHNVTLKYSTPLLKEGALVSLAGVAIFAMQLVINKRKKRE